VGFGCGPVDAHTSRVLLLEYKRVIHAEKNFIDCAPEYIIGHRRRLFIGGYFFSVIKKAILPPVFYYSRENRAELFNHIPLAVLPLNLFHVALPEKCGFTGSAEHIM